MIAFMLSACALTLIAAGMERHAKQLGLPSSGDPERSLRFSLGGLLLVISLYLNVATYGVSIGAAVWLGELSLAQTLIAALFTWRPRWLLPVLLRRP